MIIRLKEKHWVDFYDFVLLHNFSDFYITEENNRIFLNKINLIKKIILKQECFGKFIDGNLKSICIVLRQKPYRTYLKIIGDKKDCGDLLKFIKWNFCDIEIYCKIKKDNSILNELKHNSFFIIGNRGQEILLVKKKFIPLRKTFSKDGEKNGIDYNKN